MLSYRTAFTSLLIGLLLAGCGGSDEVTTSDKSAGYLSLDVTDAPVDEADAVVIHFDAVTVQPEDGERQTYSVKDPVTGQSGRSIDLLQLAGGESVALLDSQQLTAGQYSWVRLDVDLDPTLSFIEILGQRHELRCTSCNNNGLKLNRSFNIPVEGIVAFTIDFDLRSSITDPQSGTHYILRPTLRIVDTELAGNIAGTVDGTLIANLGGGSCGVYLYEGSGTTPNDIFLPETGNPPSTWNNPVSSASVDLASGSYTYEAGYLPAGTYTVALTCDIQDEDPLNDDSGSIEFTGIDMITVTAGATTTKDFTL
jgi:hypothetical protein